MQDPDRVRVALHADLYRFLSACYYEPTPAFAEERLFESMQAAAAPLDRDLADSACRLGKTFSAHSLQDLLVDHTRLFLGPVQPLARPYGSFWLSGETTLMQDSTLDVLALYREGGFDIDEAFHDLPDHVAVELEFLYLLTFRQVQSMQFGDPAAASTWDGLRQRFLHRHLGAWIGPFTAAMHAGAETAFYRELADLTDRLIRR